MRRIYLKPQTKEIHLLGAHCMLNNSEVEKASYINSREMNYFDDEDEGKVTKTGWFED